MKWWKAGEYWAKSDADYYICWSGPKGALIYTAWAPEPWLAFQHTPIGYFRGPEAKQQALDACKRHWEERQRFPGNGSNQAR